MRSAAKLKLSVRERRADMKVLVCFLTVTGLASNTTVGAQGIAPDFSGIYEGSSTIVEPGIYPFTSRGEQEHAAYDPLVGDPRQVDDCAPESMPAILWAGTLNTMEITHDGDIIVMHLEHGGTFRSIHVNGDEPATGQPRTELGISRGTWIDETLTIETTHLAGGVLFTNRGFPISSEARLMERYRRESGKNLQMEFVIDDPVNYTQPLRLAREWFWAPNEQVLPWDCISLGPRDAEPDIDELRRLLR
jgi:hypothetical protein